MDETGSPDGGGLPWGIPRQSPASDPDSSDRDPDLRDAVITGQEDITAMTSALRRSSRRDWMTLHSAVIPPTDWKALDVPVPERVRTRAIYDDRFAGNPEGLRLVRQRAAAGEEARVYPGVNLSFRLADSYAALLVMPFTAELAILVLDQPGPGGLRESFELMWEDATAFRGSRAVPARARSPRRGP